MPADQARGRSVPLIFVLRAEVRTETATPTVEELVLIFGGRFLDNSERLTEINGDRGPIEDKTTLHVMVRFKADGPGAPRPLLACVVPRLRRARLLGLPLPLLGVLVHLLSMDRWPESALTIVGACAGKGGADGSNRGCCIIS